MVIVVQKARFANFHHRNCAHDGLSGLFWRMPERHQRERIRQLARSLTPEQVSSIVKRSVAECREIIEGRR
ncbi:MAG TPA: hypothetical protein VMU67_13935 [Steroidobacteraceae bacterium]|nr:hypothetical protein [Steroidobacteraceae bacterium]